MFQFWNIIDEVSDDWHRDYDKSHVRGGEAGTLQRSTGKGLQSGVTLFGNHMEMLSSAADFMTRDTASETLKEAQEDPWLFATSLLISVLLEKLRSTLGVQGVELCRGVPQLWEFVVASLFSLWVSVPAIQLYTTRPVKPTQHLNKLAEIKAKLPGRPKDRRWMDMLKFIPHVFSDKCSVKAKGKDSLPTLDTLCLLYTSPSPRDRTRSRMPSSA